MFDFLAGYLGQFLYFIYKSVAFESYGLALIIFTIAVKMILLPLTIKQYRSTAKMQEIQPEIQEIQKRYKNDKEKLNQELMKVYQENKVNPAGGCLPVLLQFPILISLFYVIRKPMTYVLAMTKESMGQVLSKVQSVVPMFDPSKIADYEKISNNYTQLFEAVSKKDPYLEAKMMDAINNSDKLTNMIGDSIEVINMTFLKIFNLGMVPTWNVKKMFDDPGLYVPLFLLVILTAAVTFFSSKIMMVKNNNTSKGNNDGKNDAANAMAKNMMYVGPIMTLWIGFSAPAGLVFYWLLSSVTQVLQQVYINKHVLKKEEVKS